MLSPGRAKWSVVVTHRGKLAANDANRCRKVTLKLFFLKVYFNSVFLVDHAWTFQPHLVARQLQSVPGLAGRMAALMDLDGFPCLSGEEADRCVVWVWVCVGVGTWLTKWTIRCCRSIFISCVCVFVYCANGMHDIVSYVYMYINCCYISCG